MNIHNPIAHYETRSEDGGEADPVVAATRAVEELRSSVATFRTETDTKLTTELRALTRRLDEIDARSQRPGAAGSGQRDEAAEVEKRAFVGFIRRGREALPDTEVRALRVAVDTSGGFLAPPDFSAEVVKNLVQFSPVRQAARVGTTASGEVIIPRRTGALTASWVDELEDRPSTEPSYGQATIPVHEASCYVDVSNKLLEDAAVDINGEVAADLAEEFGRLEGVAFVSGNGVKKPTGFMSDANVGYTAGGHATAIQTDGLIDLFYALKPFYRGRAVWMMNGSTLSIVRKIKDSNGQYLWQPALSAGQPETLLGRPVVEAVDMPDVAANAYPIAFGDFQSGYRIYDRVSLAILRDPFSLATVGQTRFHARRRVGGAVTKAEAILRFKVATS
jgi:HK97 family phage major capsid protein